MQDKFSDELISAYLDGELTPSEQARVEQMLADSPAHQQLFDELRALAERLQGLPECPLDQGLTRRIVGHVEQLADKSIPSNGAANGVSDRASGGPTDRVESPGGNSVQVRPDRPPSSVGVMPKSAPRVGRERPWQVATAVLALTAAGLLVLLIFPRAGSSTTAGLTQEGRSSDPEAADTAGSPPPGAFENQPVATQGAGQATGPAVDRQESFGGRGQSAEESAEDQGQTDRLAANDETGTPEHIKKSNGYKSDNKRGNTKGKVPESNLPSDAPGGGGRADPTRREPREGAAGAASPGVRDRFNQRGIRNDDGGRTGGRQSNQKPANAGAEVRSKPRTSPAGKLGDDRGGGRGMRAAGGRAARSRKALSGVDPLGGPGGGLGGGDGDAGGGGAGGAPGGFGAGGGLAGGFGGQGYPGEPSAPHAADDLIVFHVRLPASANVDQLLVKNLRQHQIELRESPSGKRDLRRAAAKADAASLDEVPKRGGRPKPAQQPIAPADPSAPRGKVPPVEAEKQKLAKKSAQDLNDGVAFDFIEVEAADEQLAGLLQSLRRAKAEVRRLPLAQLGMPMGGGPSGMAGGGMAGGGMAGGGMAGGGMAGGPLADGGGTGNAPGGDPFAGGPAKPRLQQRARANFGPAPDVGEKDADQKNDSVADAEADKRSPGDRGAGPLPGAGPVAEQRQDDKPRAEPGTNRALGGGKSGVAVRHRITVNPLVADAVRGRQATRSRRMLIIIDTQR